MNEKETGTTGFKNCCFRAYMQLSI